MNKVSSGTNKRVLFFARKIGQKGMTRVVRIDAGTWRRFMAGPYVL